MTGTSGRKNDELEFCNLKCPPEQAEELRERYEGIRPGWHMNKRHRNSVCFRSDVPDSTVFEPVRPAYETEVAYVKFLRSIYRVPIQIIPRKSDSNISGKYIESCMKDYVTTENDRTFLMFDLDVDGMPYRIYWSIHSITALKR